MYYFDLSASLNLHQILFSLSPFLFRRREGDAKGTTDYARGRGGAQGRPPAFITMRCHNRGGKAVDPYKAQ
jgi:hypothetical protein